MIRTRVGYAGGAKENPTYHNLGDHTETLQIDYDSSKISYEKLLELFWEEHDPTSRSWSRQYKAVVFYHDEEQKRLAIAGRDRAGNLGPLSRPSTNVFAGFYMTQGVIYANSYPGLFWTASIYRWRSRPCRTKT